jgi:hypothetical protein
MGEATAAEVFEDIERTDERCRGEKVKRKDMLAPVQTRTSKCEN